VALGADQPTRGRSESRAPSPTSGGAAGNWWARRSRWTSARRLGGREGRAHAVPLRRPRRLGNPGAPLPRAL